MEKGCEVHSIRSAIAFIINRELQTEVKFTAHNPILAAAIAQARH
ncbi:hypothetical protein [Gloeocapsopsis crepidinum]|nr:hypothetical protein [Gloeocapsopsis crepidinum]